MQNLFKALRDSRLVMSGVLEVPAADATFAHDGEAGALGAGETTLEAGDNVDFKPKKQPRQADNTPINVNASLSLGKESDEQGVTKRKESVIKRVARRDKVPKRRSLNGVALRNSETSPTKGEENERGGKEGGDAVVSNAAAQRLSWLLAMEENEAQQKLEQERLKNAEARATKADEVYRARKKELEQWMEAEQNNKHSGKDGPPPMKQQSSED